jgi:dihydroxyacetone kinase-like predicted kinase
MQKFVMEFILHCQGASEQAIQSSLSEFGEGVEVTDCCDSESSAKNFKVNMLADDPMVIFDVCAQFGRIKSVKIDEKEK